MQGIVLKDRNGKAWWSWLSGRMGRKGFKSYRIRVLVQAGFAVACVLLGLQFARFVSAAQAGRVPLPHRPPGVEAFLPISGLMGLVDWVRQGTLNVIHPAATMILLVVLAMTLLLRKSFCSWVCPVGFLSETLARLGRRLLGRNFLPWKWLDVPLRGLKYLLLAFFVWAIFSLDGTALRAFIESPFNKISDVRTGLFFVEMGRDGLIVLGWLAVASILIKGFWCRYLCPYGALLGLFSWLSPARIERNPQTCIDCGLCDRACMARLPVSRKLQVISPECVACLDCVAVCPVQDALGLKTARRRLSARRNAPPPLLRRLSERPGLRALGERDQRRRVRPAHPGERRRRLRPPRDVSGGRCPPLTSRRRLLCSLTRPTPRPSSPRDCR